MTTRICADWADCIVLHCNFSSLYDVNDLIFHFLCVSPEGSTIYDNVSEPNGILQMQDKFHELKYMYPSAYVVIAGDLNARTKNLIDYIRNDVIFYVFGGDVDYSADSFDMPRNKKDCYRFNNFGKSLTDFCRSHDMHIMNGRLFDDNEGNYTCLSNDGRSVVDYFITDTDMFKYVSYFTIGDRDDSDHYPVICNLSL